MDRTPCCILGCRRTTKHDHSEWICGKHWKLVPKRYKRVWSRAKRRVKSRKRDWAIIDRLWDRIKNYVYQKALGI